ncbi:hypothetical protein KC363_g514 [Hortaea werneckii]|uniref:Beta-lactamase-related domain-containing protein n=1 Tax=Hortaea werneckii TaxID=91943 RepID=A0A3M7G512_HORWE|nr:hypothetical protein KC363_g514 [Hortaea werneckii]RMY95731.1 hypothetical protein D0861_00608 [Hortaea werneckii]
MTLERLTKIVTADILHVSGVPSASIGILEDGKISATVITNGAENAETLYQACSISKAITALAVARLDDDGHFSYDTRVRQQISRDVLAGMLEPLTAHLMDHVTVRMLLSHTSGLSQHGFPGYSRETPHVADVLSGNPPANTPKVRFDSFPGAQFSYSGGGFTVFQVFLEQVMQRPFREIMYETVLKPLNMTRSVYGDLHPDETDYAKAHLTASVQADVEYNKFTEPAAAGLWTTPTDLLKAIAAVQESLLNDSGFLKPATAKEMLTQIPQDSGLTNMALGWGSDASVFGHSGANDPGYQCYVFGAHGGMVNGDLGTEDAREGSMLPPRNGLAVMTNSVEGMKQIKKIVGAVFFLKQWPRFQSLVCQFGKADFVPYSVQGETGDEWRQWAGRWEGGWSLVDNHGRPSLAFNDLPPQSLVPAAMPLDADEHMFVAVGLGLAVRMMQKGGNPVVELIQGGGSKILGPD